MQTAATSIAQRCGSSRLGFGAMSPGWPAPPGITRPAAACEVSDPKLPLPCNTYGTAAATASTAGCAARGPRALLVAPGGRCAHTAAAANVCPGQLPAPYPPPCAQQAASYDGEDEEDSSMARAAVSVAAQSGGGGDGAAAAAAAGGAAQGGVGWWAALNRAQGEGVECKDAAAKPLPWAGVRGGGWGAKGQWGAGSDTQQHSGFATTLPPLLLSCRVSQSLVQQAAAP